MECDPMDEDGESSNSEHLNFGGAGMSEELIEYLTKYADDLEAQTGTPDPEIRAKIAQLKHAIASRDDAVKEISARMEAGGTVEILTQLQTMEKQVATVEQNLQDPEVMKFMAASSKLWNPAEALAASDADDGAGGAP